MSMSKPFSSQIMHFLEDGFFLSSHKPATRKTLDSGKVLFKTNPMNCIIKEQQNKGMQCNTSKT